jgi:hypothetical protein
MMPTPLPGFLLVAGTLLIVLSFMRGSFQVEKVKIPSFDESGRAIVRVIGVIFCALALSYIIGI